jgi:hypothetical protein
MTARTLSLCLLGLTLATGPAGAQQPQTPPFEDLVFLSCSDAQAMPPEQRVAVALALADRAAKHYGIALPDNQAEGRELGLLVRGGCTMFPQALLFGVIAQAVRLEAERLKAAR